MSNLRIGVLVTLAALVGSIVSAPAFAESQARIVRLSYVEGEVQIDRNAGQGFEKAFLNLPIVQGSRVRTGSNGFAEVEFEDGTTVRLVSGTQITFPRLGLLDSGSKASSVDLTQGMVYVSFVGAKEKDNEFRVVFGPEIVALTDAAHLRLAMGRNKASLSVFKGEVQVSGPSGVAVADKKQSLNFELSDPGTFVLAKKVEESPYDSWDKDQDNYRQRYARNGALSNSSYTYGQSDLNYYGSFFNAPGYGQVWQPYFVGAGWDPFMSGAWAYYPGAGYSWVSAYPWGWAPFHSGSWQFIPSYGWAWQPGGVWTGLNNAPRPVNPPSTFRTPVPPSTPARGLLIVNRGPITGPVASPERMVIRNNSAGLGVPRGSIQNLSRASSHAEQHGSATASFRTPPAAAAYNPPAGSAAGAGSPRSAAAGPSGGSYPSGANSRPSMSSGPTFHGNSAPAASSSGGGSRGASPTHR